MKSVKMAEHRTSYRSSSIKLLNFQVARKRMGRWKEPHLLAANSTMNYTIYDTSTQLSRLSKFSRVSSGDQYRDNRLYAQQIENDKTPDFAFFKNQRRPNANDLPIILKNSKDILHGRQVYTSNYVKARHNHCVACNSDKDHAKDKGKRLFFQRASSTLASNAGECRGVTA